MMKMMSISSLICLLLMAICQQSNVTNNQEENYSQEEVLKANFPIPDSLPYFLQNDSEWIDDQMGFSKGKMGSYGCLVSVISTLLVHYGYKLTPKDVNAEFTKQLVYDHRGRVLWSKIKKAYPDVKYRLINDPTDINLERLLEDGFYPIVKVKYYGIGIFHFVLVIGKQDKTYYIIDPLHQDKKAIPLDTHGDIYSCRLIYK